jgi:outer membrane receptor protein involved in Fe transport
MKKTILLFFLLQLPITWCIAQIQGRVTEADTGSPLPGATIRLIDTSLHATTNSKGEFILTPTGPQAPFRLRISYVGYTTREVTAEALPANLNVQLETDMSLLGTVVVTASRGQREMYDLPLRVHVLKKEAVDAIPALSADDYLMAIPGVTVRRGASFLGSGNVSLRGAGNEAGRTLVLVDGVPVNKSDGGSVNWNAINPGDIQQLEVMKGPGSSIYGGNAMGGVINLISPLPHSKLQGRVSQTAGSFDTYNTQTRLSGRTEQMHWAVNGRYRQSDGYITTPADEIDEYSVASFLDEYQFGGRLGTTIQKNHLLEASTSWYSGKRGTGSNFSGYGFQNDDLAAPRGAYNHYSGINGRLTYRGTTRGGIRLNANLYGQRENYQNIRESLRSGRITRYDVESVRSDAGLLSSASKTIGHHLLTAGIDARNGGVDGRDVYLTSTDLVINQGHLLQLGIYLQDEVRLGQTPWSLLAGLRYDRASFYNGSFVVKNPTNETAFLQDYAETLPDATFSALSPRISLQYHQEGKYRLFGGYSKGFRAPVLDDMSRTGRISGGMKLANPYLKPEYLDHFEIGGDLFLGQRLTLSPGFFYATGTDYHAYISTGDSLMMNNRMRPIRIMDNIGKVEIKGFEAALSWKALDGLQLNLAYNHQDSEIVEYRVLNPAIEEGLEGKTLVYQPNSQLHASIHWKNPVVNVFVSFNQKGAQWMNEVNTESIESYHYLDLHLWRTLGRGFLLSFKGHNMLDRQYVDSRNMIGPGRIMMFELGYSF